MTTVHPFTDAPVMFLVGYGFRPAHMPADYVGPRMDCPMWLPAPDADAAYLAKYDAPASGYAWGTVLPSDTAPIAPQITAASLTDTVTAVSATPHPSQWWPVDPLPPVGPCCVIREPEPELPPVAPVPLPASSGLLLAGLALLWLWGRA